MNETERRRLIRERFMAKAGALAAAGFPMGDTMALGAWVSAHPELRATAQERRRIARQKRMQAREEARTYRPVQTGTGITPHGEMTMRHQAEWVSKPDARPHRVVLKDCRRRDGANTLERIAASTVEKLPKVARKYAWQSTDA